MSTTVDQVGGCRHVCGVIMKFIVGSLSRAVVAHN